MNTIAHNFASKLFVAFVAVAMLVMLVAPSAKAATTEELQAQIAALMAQITALQAQAGQGGQSVASGVCPFTWTRTLTSGTTGADVMKLQQFLNADVETRVSASGVGSVGMETEYFGPATAAAVSKFQVKYRSDVLSPAGLVNPTGTFGPASMAKMNAICNSASTDDTDNTDDTDDSDNTSSDLSGEASLKAVDITDGDDTDLEEGQTAESVQEFQIEFNDGDAMITRLDVELDDNASNDDAWDVFGDVTLYVDGDEVGTIDASDEDNWQDDEMTLRFSGLDIVAQEDEEITVTLGVEVQSNLDTVPVTWDVDVLSMRFVDGEDVTSTEDVTVAAGSFDIDVAGAGDDLNLESSNDDPDAMTIALDEEKNVEEAIFSFELSADDSDGSVDLSNLITLSLTVTNPGTTADDLDDLVDDLRLEIDGQSFDAESYTGATTTSVDFDIDGDVTIDENTTVTATLYADFDKMAVSESAFEGSTIVASVAAADIDAEGTESGENITVDGSTKTGNVHTLRTNGLDLGGVTDGTGSSDSVQVVSGVATDDNYGTMFLTFDVTAFGDNLFVKANDAVRGASSTAGVAFVIEDSTGATVAGGTSSVSYVIADADKNNGFYELEDGTTYEMTVTVDSYNPAASGTYHLQVLTVGFAATEVNATDTEAPSDLGDYESDAVAIQS